MWSPDYYWGVSIGFRWELIKLGKCNQSQWKKNTGEKAIEIKINIITKKSSYLWQLRVE